MDQQQEPECTVHAETVVEPEQTMGPSPKAVAPNESAATAPPNTGKTASPQLNVSCTEEVPPPPPSSSLADRKREILSSRRSHTTCRNGGPASPMRSNNNPSLAASTDYLLAAQVRAADLLQVRRRPMERLVDADPSSPNMLSSSSERSARGIVGHGANSSAGAHWIRGEHNEVEIGGIDSFVAEARVMPVVYAKASTVVPVDAVEAAAAQERRKIVAYLILAGIVLVAIVLTPVILLTTKQKIKKAPTMPPTIAPTMAPTKQVIPLLASELQQYVTDTEALRTRGTPQSEAMFWMALDEFSGKQGWDVQSERYVQRFVLAVIYFALNGDKWENCARTDRVCSSDGTKKSWLTNSNECEWNMITCDGDSRVIALVGANNVLGRQGTSDKRAIDVDAYGQIPPEITHLTALVEISLQGAPFVPFNVKGPLLTYLSKMNNLQVLKLRNGVFTGSIPSEFAATHPALVELDLENNSMTGPIPDLTGWQAMRSFDLSGNMFVGTIPSSIGAMQALTSLYLHKNWLTGVIPSSLDALTKLRELDLSTNRLTGEIPLAMYTLTALTVLRLGDNALRGTIANEIGILTSLNGIVLGPSLMAGTLPPDLFTLTALKTLAIHDSKFYGNLRNVDFAQIADTISVLQLENNDFSGLIPIDALESVQQLKELHLYGNPKLTGTVTQTFCSKRGFELFQIEEMEVGCNVVCVEGCCSSKEGDCASWPVSSSDLPE